MQADGIVIGYLSSCLGLGILPYFLGLIIWLGLHLWPVDQNYQQVLSILCPDFRAKMQTKMVGLIPFRVRDILCDYYGNITKLFTCGYY